MKEAIQSEKWLSARFGKAIYQKMICEKELEGENRCGGCLESDKTPIVVMDEEHLEKLLFLQKEGFRFSDQPF